MTGQEVAKGHGNFTATKLHLEKLRDQGFLVDRIRVDQPLPGSRMTPASMQIWLLDPAHNRKRKVTSPPTVPICLSIRLWPCSIRLWPCRNYIVAPFGLSTICTCPAWMHYQHMPIFGRLLAKPTFAYVEYVTTASAYRTHRVAHMSNAQFAHCLPSANLLLISCHMRTTACQTWHIMTAPS